MTDDQFRALCNTYGFAPSRSLRELLDTAVAQARIAEREACVEIVNDNTDNEALCCADDLLAAIRARSQA